MHLFYYITHWFLKHGYTIIDKINYVVAHDVHYCAHYGELSIPDLYITYPTFKKYIIIGLIKDRNTNPTLDKSSRLYVIKTTKEADIVLTRMYKEFCSNNTLFSDFLITQLN